MAKALLIAEKPSLMRDVQNVYQKRGFKDQIDFIAFHGHSMKLGEPGEQNEDWNKWDINLLPMIPEKFKYKVNDVNTFNAIKKKIKEGNYDYLINCCDPDREGCAIFHTFYQYLNCKLPVQRIWILDTTEDNIYVALNNMQDDLKTPMLVNMTKSSLLRAEFDWLVGMNFSRAVSLRSNASKGVAIGRVMTPTLKMIVDRELEIKNFIPKDSWVIKGLFDKKFDGIYFTEESKDGVKFDTEQEARNYANNICKDGVVESVEKKKETKYAPNLYSLGDIQKDANRSYGYTFQETLDIIQALYEKKLLSYPRTDCRFLSSKLAESFPKMLKAISSIGELSKVVNQILDNNDLIKKTMNNKKYVDDKKVTAHYAITPTGAPFQYDNLTESEKNIMLLVAKRLVAIFLPPIISQKTVVISKFGEDRFKTNGSILLDKGYSVIYGTSFNQNEIPPINKGDKLSLENIELIKKTTTPPNRYTDGSLGEAMMYAGKFTDDADEKAILKEVEGIGTPATRASIMEKLITTKTVVRKGKTFYPTDYGISLILNLKGKAVTSVEMTAKWEALLKKVEEGEIKDIQFKNSMNKYIREEVEVFKKSSFDLEGIESRKSGGNVIGKCPVCGEDVIEGKDYYFCKNYKKTCKLIVGKTTMGAKISKKDLVLLLAGKETSEKSFTFKDGKKGKGKLILDKEGLLRFAGKSGGANTVKVIEGVKCPKCGSIMKETNSFYLCEKYKDGCDFLIGKKIMGADITKEDFLNILDGKETEEKEFYFEKSKSKGKGKLKLKADKSLVIVFPEQKKVGKCPKCGKDIVDTGKYFKCVDYKKGCDFLISQDFCNAKISLTDLKTMLEGKETEEKTFTWKSNKTGQAKLTFDKDFKLTFVFADKK